MSERIADYIGQMRQAAIEARAFVSGMREDEFLADTRTQRAVIMSLFIIGEAASKVMALDPDFADEHPETPWRAMRGMRNRIAHGYFDIDLGVVWQTVDTALGDLLNALPDDLGA